MKNLKKFKIIYLGTPEIAIKPLKKLIDLDLNISAVLTQPNKEKGRGKKILEPPIKKAAEELNIICLQPKNKEELRKTIKEISPDLAIIFAYGMIIPTEVLESVPYGFINIHPSLLPKNRGPSPIQAAILNNEKITGVSIIKLDKNVDSGPILKQESLEINPEDNALTLGDKLSGLGSNLLAKTLVELFEDRIEFAEQDDDEATFTKIIKKEDGKINWNKPASEIEREIRAYTPWPGSYTSYNDKVIKIIEAEELADSSQNVSTGLVTVINREILVGAKNGLLKISKLQLEGGNIVTAKEFLNGHPEINGTTLS